MNSVEALYAFESTSARGHTVIVQPGERFCVVAGTQSNPDWLYVTREGITDDAFYIPTSYLKRLDVEPSVSTFLARHASDSNQRRSQLFSSDGYKLLSTSGSSASALPAGQRRPNARGFKLADPKRISKSIPVELNFVHNMPDLSGGGEHMVNRQSVAKQTQLFTAMPTSTDVDSVAPPPLDSDLLGIPLTTSTTNSLDRSQDNYRNDSLPRSTIDQSGLLETVSFASGHLTEID